MGAVKKKNRLGHRDRSWKIFLAVMAVIALIPLVYALSLSVRTQNSIYDPRLFCNRFNNWKLYKGNF